MNALLMLSGQFVLRACCIALVQLYKLLLT